MFEQSDNRNDYQRHADQLKDRIHELRLLRDAQADGSVRQHQFQQEIQTLTEEYLAWRDAEPHLVAMDREIAVAEHEAKRVRREADVKSDNMWSTARTLGIIGLVALLVAVVFNPHWLVWVVALVLVTGATGAVVYGTRSRAGRYAAVHEAADRVLDLVDQRDLMVPGQEPAPTVEGYPLVVDDQQQAQAEGVPEQTQPDGSTRRLALVAGGSDEVVDAEIVD